MGCLGFIRADLVRLHRIGTELARSMACLDFSKIALKCGHRQYFFYVEHDYQCLNARARNRNGNPTGIELIYWLLVVCGNFFGASDGIIASYLDLKKVSLECRRFALPLSLQGSCPGGLKHFSLIHGSVGIPPGNCAKLNLCMI